MAFQIFSTFTFKSSLPVLLVALSLQPALATANLPESVIPASGTTNAIVTPADGPLPAPSEKTGPAVSSSVYFKGHVEVETAPEATPQDFDHVLKNLLDVSYQSEEAKTLEQAVDRFSSKKAYFKQRANDALNSIFMFKGVSVSSEAGDVILDEKIKLDSIGAAKYARQKYQDEVELKVTQDLLQIAMAMALPNSEEATKQTDEARTELAKLAGKDAADSAIASLKALCTTNVVQEHVANWSVSKTQDKIKQTVRAAALRDPIVDDIKADVHHYNSHSSVTMAAHRMIRVTLSVASLAPNIYGPASQALLFGYVVLSGGSEQSKILKELYMEKRLVDRANLLNEEAHLAFHYYQMGNASKNPALIACSRMLMTHMMGPELAQTMLTDSGAERLAESNSSVER